MKDMGPCNRYEEGIRAKGREGVSFVWRRKRGDEGVYSRAVKERVHTTIKVTSDSASVFYRKEGWKEVDSLGL